MKLTLIALSLMIVTGCSSFSKNVAMKDQLILEVPEELMKKPERLKQIIP